MIRLALLSSALSTCAAMLGFHGVATSAAIAGVALIPAAGIALAVLGAVLIIRSRHLFPDPD
jgi:hypothetical protein